MHFGNLQHRVRVGSMAKSDSRTLFPTEHLSGLALHASPSGNCSKVPTLVAGSVLVRIESRRHLGSSHLICPSACPASFLLMTQPGYTSSVAFSNQQFPREIVSQPLPSTFDRAVNVSCWGLVYIVTQQPLPWQGEMLLPFVCMFPVPPPHSLLHTNVEVQGRQGALAFCCISSAYKSAWHIEGAQ